MTATTQGVQRSIAGLTVTVHAHAAVQVETLFDTVVAEDVLPHVLLRHRFIPGVTATSDLTGPWDTPGSTRTVHLTNGRRAQERIDAYRRPSHSATPSRTSPESSAGSSITPSAPGSSRPTATGHNSAVRTGFDPIGALRIWIRPD